MDHMPPLEQQKLGTRRIASCLSTGRDSGVSHETSMRFYETVFEASRGADKTGFGRVMSTCVRPLRFSSIASIRQATSKIGSAGHASFAGGSSTNEAEFGPVFLDQC